MKNNSSAPGRKDSVLSSTVSVRFVGSGFSVKKEENKNKNKEEYVLYQYLPATSQRNHSVALSIGLGTVVKLDKPIYNSRHFTSVTVI